MASQYFVRTFPLDIDVTDDVLIGVLNGDAKSGWELVAAAFVPEKGFRVILRNENADAPKPRPHMGF
jgi:hypothetical protein